MVITDQHTSRDFEVINICDYTTLAPLLWGGGIVGGAEGWMGVYCESNYVRNILYLYNLIANPIWSSKREEK